MKRITPLKLTCAVAFVAALGVGCASTGYARYDADSTDRDYVGVAASADVGTDSDASIAARTDVDADADLDIDTTSDMGAYGRTEIGTGRGTTRMVDEAAESEARATVTALSFNPETRATWVNRFPFYDNQYKIRVIETLTFAAPDPTLSYTANRQADLPEFSVDMPPGSVFVEAAGGAGEVRTGRVIQHSPNPR